MFLFSQILVVQGRHVTLLARLSSKSFYLDSLSTVFSSLLRLLEFLLLGSALPGSPPPCCCSETGGVGGTSTQPPGPLSLSSIHLVDKLGVQGQLGFSIVLAESTWRSTLPVFQKLVPATSPATPRGEDETCGWPAPLETYLGLPLRAVGKDTLL